MQVLFSNTSTPMPSTTGTKRRKRLKAVAGIAAVVISLVAVISLTPFGADSISLVHQDSQREGQFGRRGDEPGEQVGISATPFAVEECEVSPDSLCTGEDGADDAVVEAVNLTLLTLPRRLRESFIRSGWTMRVVTYDIATEDYAGQFGEGLVFASTSYKARSITILNDLKAAANSPIHEVGHWLDSQVGYPTLYSEDFTQLYNEEGSAYKNTFGPTCSWNIHEFFAEGFWCYWKSPLALQKACPQFYDFLEAQLEAIASDNTESVLDVP